MFCDHRGVYCEVGVYVLSFILISFIIYESDKDSVTQHSKLVYGQKKLKITL